MPFVSRVWTLDALRQYTREGARGCWLWQRAKYPNGYARIKIGGRHTYGHRVVWRLANGVIPDAYIVHHVCGNRGCLNPAHLTVMRQSEHATLHAPERVRAWRAWRVAAKGD